MKYTNVHGLPQSLVDALKGDDYDLQNAPKNIISVTTAIAPPKAKTLELRHFDEIEQDVSELMWRMFGSACHYFIEMASKGERLSEERWYLDITTWEVFTAPIGVKAQDCKWYRTDRVYLSGKMDIYDHTAKRLEDYKVTSIWSWLIEKALKPEHEAQLNLNAFPLRTIGFPVEEAAIVMIFRDWSATSMKRGDYNDKYTGECLLPVPAKGIKAPMWNDDFTKEYIIKRVTAHMAARAIESDNDIPVCSPEERWSKPAKWAVKKAGNIKALRVHDTEEQAKIHAATDPKLVIEYRPGSDTKCESYCSAAPWCNYYQQKYGKPIPAKPGDDAKMAEIFEIGPEGDKYACN